VKPIPARVNKALDGHYKKANVPPTRVRREVKVAPGGDALKAGDQVLCSVFADGSQTIQVKWNVVPLSIGIGAALLVDGLVRLLA